VFISSELDEVVRLSQRVMVLRDRVKIAEVVNDESVTPDTLLAMIASSGVEER
jgi:galactofuranose transport system ATP-binding protein